MTETRSKLLAGAAAVILCLAGAAQGQEAGGKDAGVKPDKEIVAEQYLLMGNATRGSGESQVAVNPLNPNEIIMAAMSVINQNEGQFRHNELEFQRTTRATLTQFAVSRDRGLTWSVMEDPMRAFFHRYRCLDPFAAFAADGTMIMGCEAHFPTNLGPAEQIDAALNNSRANFGGSAIITSVDGGHSWSEPVQVISSYMPKEVFGPFVSYSATGPAGDAPKIHVDMSTGKLYIDGNSTTADAPVHSQTTIRMSKDRGRNWGVVYAFDTPEWPGGGGAFDVANGVLAVSYTASKVPDALGAKCPCTVFAVSNDDGKTFDRRLVPGPSGGGGGPTRVAVFADPSRPAHFVLLRQADNHVDELLTEDSGATWSAPRSLGQVPATRISNIAGAFNDKGQFAASWRVLYVDPKAPPSPEGPGAGRTADGGHVFNPPKESFELWSALSRDGGKTLGAPMKVSTERSPPIPRRRGNSNHSADFTSVAMDHDYVHFSWFDARSGFLGTWYGRVPLADYH